MHKVTKLELLSGSVTYANREKVKKQSPVSRKMCLLTYVENLKSSVELSLRDRLLLLVVDILFFREQKFFLLFLFFLMI